MKTYVARIQSATLGRLLGSEHHAPTIDIVARARRKSDLVDVATEAGLTASDTAQLLKCARVHAGSGDDVTQTILDADLLCDDDLLIRRSGPNNPGVMRPASGGDHEILGTIEYEQGAFRLFRFVQ